MTVALATIGDIAADLRSGFASGEEDPDGVVQFRMNNVGRTGEINWEKLRRVPSSKMRDELAVHAGDILFNATNSPELVGKTALFLGFPEPVTFSNHFIRIRTKSSAAEPAYVARWLQREFEHGRFAGMCRSWVNQASITKDQLTSLSFPLPPLDEQRRIAAILDKADGLRRKRKRALDLLDTFTQSIFFEVFGELDCYQATPVGRSLLRQFRNGLSPAKDGIFPGKVLTLSAITGGVFKSSETKEAMFATEPPVNQRVEQGEFLICRGNGNRSLVGVGVFASHSMPDTLFPDTIIAGKIDPTKFHPQFFQDIWNGKWVRSQIEKSARTTNGTFKVNQSGLESISIPMPDLALQNRYAEKIALIQLARAAAFNQLDFLTDLFSSLQHRAFSSQL